MLFCDDNIEKEFKRIESLIKFIGIPLFGLTTSMYMSRYPFHKDPFLVYHILSSFIGVAILWFLTLWSILYFRRACKKMNNFVRIGFQLATSISLSLLLVWILNYLTVNVFYPKGEMCKDGYVFDIKNLYIATMLFVFNINTIYEGFYLFLRFSEAALETERYKKESAEAQYQNLTSRLNPHFLFNSLNTLTNIVEEDSEKAVAYIQELSQVYRYVLNTQKSTWVDLPKEIKFAQSYLSLLKMRFEENIQVEQDICETHISYCILPLTIQLLLENAVKHNEISNQKPLKVKIFCVDEHLVVSNNKQIRNTIPSSTKTGLHNIMERYRFLVDKEVVIEDKEDTFTVRIPLVKIKIEDRAAIVNY